MKPIEINNTMKYNFINLLFPVIVEAQWIRVLATNLLIMRTNPAGTLITFTFPKFLRHLFSSNTVKFKNSKTVKVFIRL